MGVIYMTTNLINGKKYLGRDSNNNPNYLGSGLLLKRAIKKEGKHNFKKEIIEECETLDELQEREEYWLNFYDAASNEEFYNLHNNGKSGPVRSGPSHYMYGRRGKDSPMFGRKKTEETKRKISISNTGKKRTDEQRQKISFFSRNRRHTPETIEHLRQINLGKKNGFYGKTHSDDSKLKMSIDKKMKYKGESNPNFKGYVICISGDYYGESKTINQWSNLLNIKRQTLSKHLNGRGYKNGIKGNFFKWEHELQS